MQPLDAGLEAAPACRAGLRGLVPIGYQASPSLAVRRIAGPLSPPTQIGTRFWTGRGWKKMLENLAYLPLKLGFSLLHSSRQARMVFVGDGAALVERLGADRLELLLAPADADAPA